MLVAGYLMLDIVGDLTFYIQYSTIVHCTLIVYYFLYGISVWFIAHGQILLTTFNYLHNFKPQTFKPVIHPLLCY